MRVLDLFRAWDEDGNGLISRSEFIKGMAPLGIIVAPEDSGSLFDDFDEDGSGQIEYHELNRMLRQRMDPRDQRARVWRVHDLSQLRRTGLTYPERLPSIQVASGSQSARTVASIEQATRSTTSRFYEGGYYDIHQPSAAGGVVGGVSSYEASKMLPPNPWRWPGVRVDMDALSEIWLTPRHGMTSHSRYKGLISPRRDRLKL